MPTEANRQVAERVAWSVIGNYVEPVLRGQLIDAIEAALNAERERARQIAWEHGPCQDGCYCATDIAEKIRGSNNAD